MVSAAPDGLTSRLRKMEWRVTRIHSEVLQSYGVNMYQAMSLIYIAWYGYVRRDPDPKDARSYLLSATESGQEFATVLNQAILESDDRIMAPLSAAERKTMMNLLAKIGES